SGRDGARQHRSRNQLPRVHAEVSDGVAPPRLPGRGGGVMTDTDLATRPSAPVAQCRHQNTHKVLDCGVLWAACDDCDARRPDAAPAPQPEAGQSADVDAALLMADKAHTLYLGLMSSHGSARTLLRECADTIHTLARQLS